MTKFQIKSKTNSTFKAVYVLNLSKKTAIPKTLQNI